MIVRLLLFAGAREAAGCGCDEYDLEPGVRLGGFLDEAVERYGDAFAAVLASSRVWINGDEPPKSLATVLAADDEVAVLPPVSGG